jgi:hypothetical protein
LPPDRAGRLRFPHRRIPVPLSENSGIGDTGTTFGTIRDGCRLEFPAQCGYQALTVRPLSRPVAALAQSVEHRIRNWRVRQRMMFEDNGLGGE